MKLLLTSNGISNPSIEKALRDLVGKPTAECNFVFIPTAANPTLEGKDWLVNDVWRTFNMGWREYEFVDVAACASLPRELWWPKLEQADVILVGGGNGFYLSYWLQKSGVFQVMPKLLESKVYMGISSGGMIAGKNLKMSTKALRNIEDLTDEDYNELGPKGQSSGEAWGFVDFLIRPHLNSPHFPLVKDTRMQELTKNVDQIVYALDDNSAIKIDGDDLQVISEGEWRVYNKPA